MTSDPLSKLGPEFRNPPREFSLCPFWFWNDDLLEAEIARQMDDFQAHGVHAFVIHPRVGLPTSIGWMSERMLYFVRFAVEEAAKRGMWVVLYDEGMYPSGSSSGQVVAENPSYQCRGLELRAGTAPVAAAENVLYRDAEHLVVERPIQSVIRGLHYIGDGPKEETPPAADLLNPAAVACFIRKVYDGYHKAIGEHFGTTVKGIFTDEPSLLGRPLEKGLMPGTTDVLSHVRRLTGVDLVSRLPDIWLADSEAAVTYLRGVHLRLNETYYSQLSHWCKSHGIALMGHPEYPDDLGAMSFFDYPGQDLVWRWVLPGLTAIEGPQSTQAKAASSAMVHSGKRRNSNELAGAYGHQLTFQEFKWLTDWCFVRGQNLLIPHAFYYSTRGPRFDERPPDVGPNSAWWKGFKSFAMRCSRIAWLNTDSEQVCQVGVVGHQDHLPWRLPKILFQHQIDFNYLRPGEVEKTGSRYKALLLEDGEPHPTDLIERLSALGVSRTMDIGIHPDLRVRHVRKNGADAFLMHNENGESFNLPLGESGWWVELETLETTEATNRVAFGPYEFKLLIK